MLSNVFCVLSFDLTSNETYTFLSLLLLFHFRAYVRFVQRSCEAFYFDVSIEEY